MGHQAAVNFIVMLGVSALMAGEALVAWRRLRCEGRGSLSLALSVGAVGSLFYAVVFALGKGPAMVHLAAIAALARTLLGAFWLIFAIRFAGVHLPHARWLETALVGTAVGMVVAVAADPSLMYSSSARLTALSLAHVGVLDRGALFPIQMIWSQVLVVAGIVVLLGAALRSWRLYRTQVLALVGAVGTVLVLEIAFMAGLQPVKGLQLGLAVLAGGMLPLIWALPRLRTVDLFAAWQPRILEEMSDAVLVTDGEGRIVNANRAAQRLLTAVAQGGPTAKTLADCAWLTELGIVDAAELDGSIPDSAGVIPGRTVTTEVDRQARHFDLRQSTLRDPGGREVSRILVLRDLTERIDAAKALDEANDGLRRMHANSLLTLCTALNAKDSYTLGHTARVAAYMILVGRDLGWNREAAERIGEAAYLHDIGKIGIPDRVLTKASKLNEREWKLMRQHPVLSADIIRPLYAEDAVLGVRHHHERYDGGGYPDGLAGEEIPLIARAMCVVDSYDAMAFERPYHRGLSFTDCLAELEFCKGSQFDPVMVEAFVRVLADISSVRRRGLTIGAQAAALIDVEAHAALAQSGAEDAPAYLETVRILRAVRDANPGVRHMATMARRGAGHIIVCDAEKSGKERSPLGEAVVADEELRQVLAGESPDICIVSADQYGVWISAMAPLTRSDGEVVGAVSVDFPAYERAEKGGLRGDATQMLTMLLVGASERMSRAKADAAVDQLTGLVTHSRLHEVLAERLSDAERVGGELSLILCDVDRLADFNGLVGHPHGDEALRLIGQLIESASRPADLCARFGGDEFAVVLGDGGGRAMNVAEALRGAVEAAKIDAGGRSLTMSVGVATYPWDGQSKDALIGRARWAVDLAKRRGRNRCVRSEGRRYGSIFSSREQSVR